MRILTAGGAGFTVPWCRENRIWWEPLKAPPREQGLLLTARAASALGAP